MKHNNYISVDMRMCMYMMMRYRGYCVSGNACPDGVLSLLSWSSPACPC